MNLDIAESDGARPSDVPEIPVNDGVPHPSDRRDAPEIVGTLRFEPAR